MRSLSAALCTGLLLSAALAHATPTYLDPDPDATRRVSAYLDSKDCPGAVKALNDGVKSKQRDVLLLAYTDVRDRSVRQGKLGPRRLFLPARR
ncbi:hypothetical protein LP419_31130 [Massilia sp. H-1]|nr:hypothetical protein LP419_31130 [Massilia sp. H-1]